MNEEYAQMEAVSKSSVLMATAQEWEPGSLRDELERLHKMAESIGHGLTSLTHRLAPICKLGEVPVTEAVPQPQPLCDIGGEIRRVSDILHLIDRDLYHLTNLVDLR